MVFVVMDVMYGTTGHALNFARLTQSCLPNILMYSGYAAGVTVSTS